MTEICSCVENIQEKINKPMLSTTILLHCDNRVREVGDSELSNICGQQSSVSLLFELAEECLTVKLFSRKKISYMNDISF